MLYVFRMILIRQLVLYFDANVALIKEQYNSYDYGFHLQEYPDALLLLFFLRNCINSSL